MKRLLIIILLSLAIHTAHAANSRTQDNAKTGAGISEVYKPITVRTYFLESNTQSTYKDFLQAFKAGQLQTVANGYKLVNGQFYKAFKRVWKYTEKTPFTIKGYKGTIINKY